MSHLRLRLVLRCAVAVSGVAVLGGCVGGFNMPRRLPGSNITLPQATESRLLDALIACQLGEHSASNTRAAVDCDGRHVPEPLADPQRAGPTRTP